MNEFRRGGILPPARALQTQKNLPGNRQVFYTVYLGSFSKGAVREAD